jgi:arsenate reductase-like glutaredoxin family protein
MREFFEERLSVEEIAAVLIRLGKTPKEMLATRSQPYHALGLAQRTLRDDELVGLMAEYPALLRRPIIVAGDRGHVGFNRVAIERFVAELGEGDNGHG